MVDRLGDHFSLVSLTESFSLGWVICFALFGLAYYTNPSEKSFKSFLDKFPISPQRSLPKVDHHPNRGHHPITRSRSKTQQQQSSKLNSANRNLKNASHSLPASPQSSIPSLSTFNRHNLLLCTLISVDRTQNLALHISFDHPEDDSYPQLEWFLGCFDTWFALRRQIPPFISSLPLSSIHQTLKTLWDRCTWPIPDVLLPQKLQIDESLQDPSPLIKPKRKKSHRSPKPHSLQCRTTDLYGHSTECSTPDNSFTPTSGRESDCYSAQQPSSNYESGQLLATPNHPVGPTAQNDTFAAAHPRRLTPSSPTPGSRTPGINEGPQSIDAPNDVVCHPLTPSDSPLSSDRSVDQSPLTPPSCNPCQPQTSVRSCDPEPATSMGGIQFIKNDHQPPPGDLDKRLKESKPKVHQENVDKTSSCQSSPKRLNEAKDSKASKQSNLDQRQDGAKSPQANPAKQSSKPKAEIWVSHRKTASINGKLKKETQPPQKEDESAINPTRTIRVDTVKPPKTKDVKVIKKNDPKDKLVTRQTDSIRKREVNLKPTKPNGNPVVTRKIDRKSPVQEPEVRQVAPAPPHSHHSSPARPPSDRAANLSVNLLHNIPMASTPPITHMSNPMMHPHMDNLNSSYLFHEVSPQYPLSDPWAPDPWAEAIQQSHIRDSFITLPNLERSALKDHYPILRGLDHASPLHSFSSSPLSEEVFHYQQELNLPPHMNNSPEWPCPPPIQTSPFGAIGQHSAAAQAPAHSSPVLSSSLFRFPGPQAHAPHLIENAFLARPNSATRKENISRTSSSNSLSQLPGFGSTRSSPSLSPYASIGNPLHPRHSNLNEVCERPGDVTLSGVNMAYPLTCGGTRDLFEEASLPQAALGHCAALRLDGISQGLMQFDPSVSSPVCNAVDGISSIQGMSKLASGMNGHHTTQSLNGIPQPSTNGLNSIFDVGSEKDFAPVNCSPKPKQSAQGLNPSAKVFAFGGSKTTSGHSSCPPVSSVERQRARGYSQSTIPTFTPPCSYQPINSSNLSDRSQEGGDKSKSLLKTLHRSSWSVVLDLKGMVSSVQDFKPRSMDTPNESASRPANRTGVLSELTRLSSAEEVLPAARSKSACSGLFGSIGDMKTKKSSASSSLNASPSTTSSILEHPFCPSPQVTSS